MSNKDKQHTGGVGSLELVVKYRLRLQSIHFERKGTYILIIMVEYGHRVANNA